MRATGQNAVVRLLQLTRDDQQRDDNTKRFSLSKWAQCSTLKSAYEGPYRLILKPGKSAYEGPYRLILKPGKERLRGPLPAHPQAR